MGMEHLGIVYLGPGRTAVALAASHGHTCAVLDNKALKCWGYNAFGQLGYDSTKGEGGYPGDMQRLGTVNLGTNRTAVSVAMGGNHTCALLDGGDIKCWGLNNYGQLGYGHNRSQSIAPGQMENLGLVCLNQPRPIIINVGPCFFL